MRPSLSLRGAKRDLCRRSLGGDASNLVYLAFAWVLAGCGTHVSTPYVGDPTEPVFPKLAPVIPEGPYCKPDDRGIYLNTKKFIDKEGKNGERFFAQGGGCIARPLREVWAVTHNKDIAAWRESDLVSFKKSDDARVTFYFQSHHEAGPSFWRVNWDMDWFQTLTQGEEKDPEYLIVKFVKTKGTSHISFWEGTIELQALTHRTTSFAMKNEIQCTQCDPRKASGSITDMYERLRTLQPDWSNF